MDVGKNLFDSAIWRARQTAANHSLYIARCVFRGQFHVAPHAAAELAIVPVDMLVRSGQANHKLRRGDEGYRYSPVAKRMYPVRQLRARVNAVALVKNEMGLIHDEHELGALQ